MKMLTSRQYESEQDLRRMYNLLMEVRSLTNDWRYALIGEFAFLIDLVFW
jgi:hypothetical protein